MPYTLIDHTADIGIRVSGATLSELFSEAGRALFDQITDRLLLFGANCRQMEVTGIDLTDLLVSFLRELLCFWTIDACLVKEIRILYNNDERLTAEVRFDAFDPDTHEILKDIKAVTYHNLNIEQTAAGWEATIIFDV